jgi:methyl-accepting chemotaxis protein
MSANAETRPVPQGAPPKRRLRNYLLDTRFQLKYTGMVVLVTVAVASVLGWFAYDHSRGQTEMMAMQIAMQPDLNPEAAADLTGFGEAEDRKVLLSIVLGILGLAFALGFTGIIVTHKLVGPAYKMRLLLNQVAEGKLKLQGRLRKGDELQELFEAFANMVESLREAQAREVAELDAAIAHAKEAGIDEGDLRAIQEVRDRMNAALD